MPEAALVGSKEIGFTLISMTPALGAKPGGAVRLLVAEGMLVRWVGIGLWLAGGLAAARAVSSLIHGVEARDPATIAAVAAVLIAVVLAGCAIPRRRTSRVDPMEALRHR